jgi:hypothetical protein
MGKLKTQRPFQNRARLAHSQLVLEQAPHFNLLRNGENKGLFLGIFLLLAFVFPGGGGRAFALSLDDLVGPERAAALLSGERPQEIQLGEPRFRLLPRHDGTRRIVEDTRAELGPGIMVETLSLYKKPAGAEKPSWSESEWAGLYNRILALSTLTGLEYYSPSRKAMRTFYKNSTVVANPSTKTAVADPFFRFPQHKLTIFARQEDLTFGDNIYQYDYYSFQDALIFVQRNLTPLDYLIFTAVRENNLRVAVTVLDAGEHLLVYAVSLAKAISLPGMSGRISNSFSARAEAMLKWFEGQADRAFADSKSRED